MRDWEGAGRGRGRGERGQRGRRRNTPPSQQSTSWVLRPCGVRNPRPAPGPPSFPRQPSGVGAGATWSRLEPALLQVDARRPPGTRGGAILKPTWQTFAKCSRSGSCAGGRVRGPRCPCQGPRGGRARAAPRARRRARGSRPPAVPGGCGGAPGAWIVLRRPARAAAPGHGAVTAARAARAGIAGRRRPACSGAWSSRLGTAGARRGPRLRSRTGLDLQVGHRAHVSGAAGREQRGTGGGAAAWAERRDQELCALDGEAAAAAGPIGHPRLPNGPEPGTEGAHLRCPLWGSAAAPLGPRCGTALSVCPLSAWAR